MSDYQGNIVIRNPATPTGPSTYGSAPGMWKLNEVAYWIKQGVWPNTSIVPDIYFPNVSLLLSTTALGNANNNLFVDSSGAFNPVSRNGNTTQGSFSPYATNWSNYFDGSGDYLTSPDNAAVQFGSGDFTIELWLNFSTTSGIQCPLVSRANTGVFAPYQLYLSGGVLYLYGSTNGSSWNIFNGLTVIPSVSVGTWYHVVLVRSGSNFSTYSNGSRQANATVSGSLLASSAPVTIGADAAGANPYTGYISNLRMVKGSAVYDPASTTITVPTSPLTAISGTSLLTCQSNRFRDASSNNFTITVAGNTSVTDFGPFSPAYPGMTTYNQSDITNWSGYFDGTSDWLATPSNAAFGFGTGDFTIECWAYPTSTKANMRLWQFSGDSDNVDISSGGSTGAISYYNGSTSTVSSSGVITFNAWNHIACVRSSGTVRVYVNGVLQVTQATTPNSSARILYIAGQPNSWFEGYISNFRVVKGTAVYTSAFTPPTSALTAISGTSLLTLQNAAFTDNSTNNFVITPNGNVTVTGNSPFNTVGYWSNYFNGSSYLIIPVTSSAFTLPGDFTLEGWVNRASGSGLVMFDSRSGGNYTDWVVGVNGSGQVDFVTVGGPGVRITTTETVAVNTWTHIACVRQGSTVKIYINGVASVNTATYSATITPASSVAWVGTSKDPVGTTGYLSNLRLVKGTALYTANFTPPTAPLTAISGTSLLTCQDGRFIDNSTNAFAITLSGSPQVQSFDPFYTATIASNGGSMYFDGNGDYLQVPDSPSLNLSGSVYTVEAWIWTTGNYSNYRTIITKRQNSSSNTCWQIYLNISNGLLSFAFGTTGYNSSVTPAANCWNHVALVYDGTNANLYLNGSRVLQTAVTNTNFASSPVSIGSYPSYGEDFIGYISGVRVLRGVQAYTGTSYTVPTAPANPTAATVLMVNGMNAGIYDATTINDLETVGNAQVSTVQSKFGGSSVYFDGTTSNRVKPPASALFAFGTGNFTVEAWVYVTNMTTENFVFDTRSSVSTAGMGFSLEPNTGKLRYSGNANNVLTSTAVSANTWTHVAWVRNGSTLTGYINGVAGGSASNSDNLTQTNGEVGNVPFSAVGTNMYIDEVRVTRGVARYTANFTPPTQPFPIY